MASQIRKFVDKYVDETRHQVSHNRSSRYLLIFLLLLILILIIVIIILVNTVWSKRNDDDYRYFRLSNTTLAVHYDLTIHPDIPGGTFDGEVNIELSIFRDTRLIFLHVKELDVVETRLYYVRSSSQRPVPIREPFLHLPNDYWVVPTKETLKSGSTYKLHLKFANGNDILEEN